MRRPAGTLRRSLVLAGAAASLLSPHGSATAADASRGLEYNCRLVATKLADEITLTFRLRTDGARDLWRVRLFHEEELVLSKRRLTNSEGNLKVVRVEPNLPGVDVFEGRARHLETGEVCQVETSI